MFFINHFYKSLLLIYSLGTQMKQLPPPKFHDNLKFVPSRIAQAITYSLLILTSSATWAQSFEYINDSPESIKGEPIINVQSNEEKTYDSITLKFKPYISWEPYAISVKNGSLTVNGDTIIEVNAVMEDQTSPGKDEGIYVLYAGGDQASQIDLNGNVNIVLKQEDPNVPFENVGLNVIYAKNSGVISIGNENSTTRIWTISSQPDVISAKDGGKVTIQSTHNQIVGNIDILGTPTVEFGAIKTEEVPSLITGVFSGNSSYWVGDEKSWNNGKTLVTSGSLDLDIASLISSTSAIDFTFENGAQWIYLGLNNTVEASVNGLSGKWQAIPKRISAITLNNGGIVNLYEASIEDLMQDTGLAEFMPDYAVKHNYVRIGDLKGSGGIFRLDLDSQNIADSDMVFVEGSSTGGMHYIEPYNLEKLTNITPENTLRFATVKTESGVTFADKQNFYGESLYDYELEIASETYDPADPNNAQYEDRVVEDGENALAFDNTYTNWVITRIIRSSSAASLAMTGIGYAAYDTITQMDSYHDRVDGQSRADNGLWVRYRYGHGGIDNQYRRDYDTLTIGAQLLHNNSQSAGIAVSLNNSDVDLVDVTGTGESDGYEVMLYNTWLLGSHYIDVVGRIGQLDTEFNAVNQIGTLSTSGDFEQNYFALSGEYGYRYTDAHNVFLEPQLQLQYTHIKSESYKTNRDLWADIDSANVLTARAGVRAGKEWSTAKTAGEVYLATNVFYQFTDGQDASYTDGTNTTEVTWGNRHAWLNVGLTANMQIQDRVNLQVQVSKDFAGDVKNTWYAQARLGYLF